jgi:hypothetical protein
MDFLTLSLLNALISDREHAGVAMADVDDPVESQPYRDLKSSSD